MQKKSMYIGKLILAPMVRIGTLPMRLLALRFGADLVYSEELIDWKLLRSERRLNNALGTVDYIDQTDGTVIFRTCNIERDRVILQIGTCDQDRAFRVGQLMQNDVAGIDINMGCPKEFSVKGGMGVALMSNPEKAEAILKKLVSGLKCPVTCKVRVLENEDASIELCKRFQACGISAIGVHGRTKDERPQHKNRNTTLKRISEALNIPVIANGGSKEIDSYNDILKFRESTGCSSVMLARAAEWNVSVFRPEGKLPLEEVIVEYLKLAVDYDNAPANTKYCIQNMLRELQESEKGKQLLESQTLQQICEIWGLGEYFKKKQEHFRMSGLIGRRDVRPNSAKRLCTEGVIELECCFIRSLYSTDPELPKTKLLNWTKNQGLLIPKYSTVQCGKLFQSIVTVNEKQYCSSFWEKSKRWAEQGAAIVCLCSIGVYDPDDLEANGVLRRLTTKV